jgi:hypothetical protein
MTVDRRSELDRTAQGRPYRWAVSAQGHRVLLTGGPRLSAGLSAPSRAPWASKARIGRAGPASLRSGPRLVFF